MSDLSAKLEVAHSAQQAGDGASEALTIFDMIGRQQESVARALPAGMDAQRFVRMVLTEVRRTPKLATCDPATLLGAMMLSAQTGLEPGGPLGQAFLIPRYSSRRKVNECQFQIGYKGYVQLAARSGVTVTARTVRDGDDFDWCYGTDEFIRHRPVLDSTEKPIAWYATGQFADGRRPVFVVIDRNTTEQAKAASASGDRGPWGTHYDAMAQKTALLRLSAFLPLSTDVSLAMAADGAVVAGPTVTVEQAADAVESERGDEDDHAEPAELPLDDEPTAEGATDVAG